MIQCDICDAAGAPGGGDVPRVLGPPPHQRERGVSRPLRPYIIIITIIIIVIILIITIIVVNLLLIIIIVIIYSN